MILKGMGKQVMRKVEDFQLFGGSIASVHFSTKLQKTQYIAPVFYLNIFFFLAEISMDWSDHALWWPEQNIWLTRTRSTLDQCGVHADALLHFTPMHKNLRVQLPDLR